MKLQKYKRDSEVSYALGATLVAELLKTHPNAITRVFLRPADKYGDDLTKILDELKARKFEIIESTKAFNILGAKDNCLLAAEFRKECLYEPQSDVLRMSGQKNIILVNPSDSGNLGTIMRSAAAFGFNEIAIVPPAVDPYDPKVIRASMGAIFHLLVRVENEPSIYPSESHIFYAFMLDKNAKTLDSITASCKDKDLTLIFGNEAAGLPKDFCEKTGATPVFIRQSDQVDSLNLGVAASIAMHYFSH